MNFKKSAFEKLSWFSSEFVVVVSGVLVALALNGWWQGIQDQRAEEAYLNQLVAELSSSIETMSIDSTRSHEAQATLSKVIRAFRSNDSPPVDSVAAWMFQGLQFFVTGVSIGTLEAIVSSEDFQLIRSDTLRSRLPVFLALSKTGNARMHRLEEFFISEIRDLYQVVDYAGLVQLTSSDSTIAAMASSNSYFRIPPDGKRLWLGAPLHEIFEDENAYASFNYIHDINSILIQIRASLLSESRNTLSLISSEQ